MYGLPIDYGSPVSAHPLNRGLAGWWLGLPRWSGGAYLRDITTKRNHGLLTGGPTWVPGPGLFAAVNGDAVGKYAEATNPIPNAADSGGQTVAVWLLPDASSGNYAIFAQWSGGSFVSRDGTGPGLYYGQDTDGGGYSSVATSGGSVFDGYWHRVCARYTGAAADLWIDGVLVNTSGAISGNSLQSGTIKFGATVNSAVAKVGDYRVWRRPLSAPEVRADYDQSRRGYPDPLNRVRPRAWSFGASVGGGGGGGGAAAGGNLLLLGCG